MELSTRTRRTITTLLAVFLAVESVSAVAAAAATATVTHPLPAQAPAGAVLAAEATVTPQVPAPAPRFSAPAWAPAIVEPVEAPAKAAKPAPEKAAPVKAKASRPKSPAKAKATPTTRPAKATPAKTSTKQGTRAVSFAGTNHVWIPELGINRSVRSFPCDRQRPPDNAMYRWGCAGANNVYLMGHAYSVMNGLHDAYVAGRLHAGMKAYYAGANGKVHVYAVKWWKITRPTTDAAWAWAGQGVPSMTLQTCVGKNSEYRLMVRLLEVDR